MPSRDDTMVHPHHRGLGLGRWLKAAMLERILEHRPEVAFINTHNADSNQPMVDINVELGFRPVLMLNVWQGDLAKARQGLGGTS
jgi:GNAT superfamily N-acetyltransferase